MTRKKTLFKCLTSIKMITDLIEGLIAGALNAQVHHGVGQGPAHVKLQGQIIHSLQLQTSISLRHRVIIRAQYFIFIS